MVTEAIKQMAKCENKSEAASGKVDSSSITEEMAAKVVGLTEQPVNYLVTFIDRYEKYFCISLKGKVY